MSVVGWSGCFFHQLQTLLGVTLQTAHYFPSCCCVLLDHLAPSYRQTHSPAKRNERYKRQLVSDCNFYTQKHAQKREFHFNVAICCCSKHQREKTHCGRLIELNTRIPGSVAAGLTESISPATSWISLASMARSLARSWLILMSENTCKWLICKYAGIQICHCCSPQKLVPGYFFTVCRPVSHVLLLLLGLLFHSSQTCRTWRCWSGTT